MYKKVLSGAIIISLFTLFLAVSGCKKFLSDKSDSSLAVPQTLADLQSLLDNYGNVNGTFSSAATEISADDYYLTNESWTSLYMEEDRRMYIWEKDAVFPTGDIGNDWSSFYSSIYYSNTVLDQLPKIERTSSNESEWNNIKGQAIFLRANRFLDIAAVWSLAYNVSTASKDLGIVLRTTSDFNKESIRSSVQETYNKIVQDLKDAILILPVVPLSTARASRPAAYALLARTFLWMGDYHNAGLYADSCLQLYNTLVDYNALDYTDYYPFKALNSEVIFARSASLGEPLFNSTAKIDSFLYQSYDSNDLRKLLFFVDNGDGTVGFRGFYSGEMSIFSGVGTDEVYLTRAESFARQGNLDEAMSDLNNLLQKRFKTGLFISLNAANSAEALQLILSERRKELLMRCLRWMDIKRENLEGAGIVLTRIINGQTYTLMPNDFRYALPIPEDIIALSKMTQNPR